MELYLGIDTSCYTTSLAIVDGEGNLLSEKRKLLEVPAGGRGLAQNEAVFQHVANLPGLFQQVCRESEIRKLRGIAASVRPRPVDGSYMPVFRVAWSYGHSVAALLGVPLVETSHQEGHLMAGIWSAASPGEEEFLALHVSGGTTELLRVVKRQANPANYGHTFDITLLGGTRDLHAGQFIDRVGVRLGLPFPAGPHLEKMAVCTTEPLTIPSAVQGYGISFSGPETAAQRLVEGNHPAADIARAVENCIARSLVKVVLRAVEDTGIKTVLVVGGVAANRHIREELKTGLGRKRPEAGIYFAEPGMSGDNAVGTALIGMEKIRGAVKTVEIF